MVVESKYNSKVLQNFRKNLTIFLKPQALVKKSLFFSIAQMGAGGNRNKVTRYYYGQGKVVLAARELFGWQEDYADEKYSRYTGLEIALQEDGRFSVWGDLGEEDAELLRDTKPDHKNLLPRVLGFADERTKE